MKLLVALQQYNISFSPINVCYCPRNLPNQYINLGPPSAMPRTDTDTDTFKPKKQAVRLDAT